MSQTYTIAELTERQDKFAELFDNVNESVDQSSLFEFEEGLIVAGLNSGVDNKYTLGWCLESIEEKTTEAFVDFVNEAVLGRFGYEMTESDREALSVHFETNNVLD